MSLVLDASTALGWCFPDERSPAGESILNRVATDGATVPAVWHFEICNALAIAQRRQRARALDVTRAVALLESLPITTDPTTIGMIRTLDAALTYDLSAYDAAYLELALRLGIPLATLDRKLATAARAAGISLLPA